MLFGLLSLSIVDVAGRVDDTDIWRAVVLNRFRLWLFRIGDRCFDAELELSLCRPIELLVDRRIGAIQDDKGSGTIGVSFKDDTLLYRYCQKLS